VFLASSIDGSIGDFLKQGVSLTVDQAVVEGVEQFRVSGNRAYSLARSRKLHYAGPVASGIFPPHPLSAVSISIQILGSEG